MATPVLTLGAVLAGIAVFVSLASQKAAPPQVEPPARVFRVPVFQVERSNVRPLVSTFGTARSEREAMIAAEVAGRVVEATKAEVGIAVTGRPEASSPATGGPAADTLVRINPDTYQQRVLQARRSWLRMLPISPSSTRTSRTPVGCWARSSRALPPPRPNGRCKTGW